MIVFLNNFLAPYHISRFHALTAILDEEIEFFELASQSSVYPWSDQSEQSMAKCLFPGRDVSGISNT